MSRGESLPPDLKLEVSSTMMRWLEEEGIGPIGGQQVRFTGPAELPPDPKLYLPEEEAIENELRAYAKDWKDVFSLLNEKQGELEREKSAEGSEREASQTEKPVASSVSLDYYESGSQKERGVSPVDMEDSQKKTLDIMQWANEFCEGSPLAWILSDPQNLAAMQHIRAHHGSSIGALASSLNLSAEDSQKITNELEKWGLIEQRPSELKEEVSGWFNLTREGREVSMHWQHTVKKDSNKEQSFLERLGASMLYGDPIRDKTRE